MILLIYSMNKKPANHALEYWLIKCVSASNFFTIMFLYMCKISKVSVTMRLNHYFEKAKTNL